MRSVSEVTKSKFSLIPAEPGVYLYYDQNETIIYVGKARILRNRVRSYFRENHPDPKTQALVSKIRSMDWIITDSEVEALLLENNFIKEHSPRYNILLKDDKTFPYICISSDRFPRVFITRNVVQNGSRYFGPYTDGRHAKNLVRTIHKIFPIRTCRHNLTRESVEAGKWEPCLQYHLHNCDAPCVGYASEQEYNLVVTEVIRFLNGQTQGMTDRLIAQMTEAAEKQEYEKAAVLRDRIKLVTKHTQTQSIVQTDFENRDVLALALSDHDAIVVIFRVREGHVIGRERFHLKQVSNKDSSDILQEFIRSYYHKTTFYPKEILVDLQENVELFEEYLKTLSGHSVKFFHPERGKKAKLLTLAQKNADMYLKDVLLQKMKLSIQPAKKVDALQQALQLPAPPIRIEGFDISHFQGKNTVASMVCFDNGQSKRSQYRRFKITSVDKPDDFQSMREVITRRYTRTLKENTALPDLVLIDGGKGQLNIAKEVLDSLGLKNIPVIGLAKRLEEVFVPGYSKAQNIPKTSPALLLLREIRDESHRFAITFNRELRSKDMVKSALDDIPGIGEKRRTALLTEFDSIAEIAAQSVETLSEKAGISKALSERIIEYLKENTHT